jgi:hypothetical protein
VTGPVVFEDHTGLAGEASDRGVGGARRIRREPLGEAPDLIEPLAKVDLAIAVAIVTPDDHHDAVVDKDIATPIGFRVRARKVRGHTIIARPVRKGGTGP